MVLQVVDCWWMCLCGGGGDERVTTMKEGRVSLCVCVLLCPREVGSAAERCGSVVVAKGTAANQRCGGCEAQSLTTLLNLTADAVDLGIATRVRSLGPLFFGLAHDKTIFRLVFVWRMPRNNNQGKMKGMQ